MDHEGIECADPSTSSENRDCNQAVSRYYTDEGYQLANGHVVATLDEYGPEFDILLKFKINSFEAEGSEPWRNIFHVSKGQDGDRYPALFLHQDGIFGIRTNDFSADFQQAELNQDYIFNIRQKKNNDDIHFQVFMNEEEIYSAQCQDTECSITEPTTQLYLSDPWYPKADITLSYFFLEKKFASCYASPASGLTLSKGQVATVLSDHGPEYDILTKFKINSYPNEGEEHGSWRNIFHIFSFALNTDRFPALFLHANKKLAF